MTSSMLLEAQEYKKHTGYPSPCHDDGTPEGGTGMTSGATSKHGASQPESRRAHNKVLLARSLKKRFRRKALKRADSPGASLPGLSTLTDPCAELQTATHGAAPLVTPGATTTFATAELARVLAEPRASQSGSEEQARRTGGDATAATSHAEDRDFPDATMNSGAGPVMKCSPCPLCGRCCTGHIRRRITAGVVDAYCTHGLPRMGIHEWTTMWKQPHSSDAESGSAPIGATSEEASGSTCTQSSDDAQDGGARYDPGDLGDPHGPWRLCCLCSRLVGDDTDSHGVAVMDCIDCENPIHWECAKRGGRCGRTSFDWSKKQRRSKRPRRMVLEVEYEWFSCA